MNNTKAHGPGAQVEEPDRLDLQTQQDQPVQIMQPKQVRAVQRQRIESKTDEILERYIDGKHKHLDVVEAEGTSSSMGEFSKVVSRLKPKEVQVDMNINAMGIFAMFPVAVEDDHE